jgi:hypothetical protein
MFSVVKPRDPHPQSIHASLDPDAMARLKTLDIQALI